MKFASVHNGVDTDVIDMSDFLDIRYLEFYSLYIPTVAFNLLLYSLDQKHLFRSC